MRIEATKFGVKTNKTLRKAGAQKGGIIEEVEKTVLKQSNSVAQVELYNGKLLKSKNNFEQIDKNERKRKLREDDETANDQQYDSEDQEEEIMVQLV